MKLTAKTLKKAISRATNSTINVAWQITQTIIDVVWLTIQIVITWLVVMTITGAFAADILIQMGIYFTIAIFFLFAGPAETIFFPSQRTD